LTWELIWAASSPGKTVFTVTAGSQVAGWLLIIAGGALIIIALGAMRLRAVAPSTQDQLAQEGIYAHIRHPIHSGTLLEFIGVVLGVPTLPVLLASSLGIGWVFLQTKFEEEDLLQRLPTY
jgi:protein-S-isoprenylcysteine O-methyltransferase Ste14